MSYRRAGTLLVATMLVVSFAATLRARSQVQTSAATLPSGESATVPTEAQDGQQPAQSADADVKQDAALEVEQPSEDARELQYQLVDSPNALQNIVLRLIKREQALIVRRHELERRAEALRKLTKKLQEKEQFLQVIDRIITKFIEKQHSFEKKQLGKYVKLYESMRPDAAARLYGELPLPVAVKLLREMREKKAGNIFSNLNTDWAVKVTNAFLKPVRLESMSDPSELRHVVALLGNFSPTLASKLASNLSDGTLLIIFQQLPRIRVEVLLQLLDPQRAASLKFALALEALRRGNS